MHEFSIAMNIVEIAEASALKNKAGKVSAVEIDMGEASGVIAEALEFAWGSASSASEVVKNAKLVIHKIPLRVQCNQCGNTFAPADFTEKCPQCGDIFTTILQGRELNVKSIMV
jgi:hydrogenase nickel incorporation protein HypA/HybF